MKKLKIVAKVFVILNYLLFLISLILAVRDTWALTIGGYINELLLGYLTLMFYTFLLPLITNIFSFIILKKYSSHKDKKFVIASFILLIFHIFFITITWVDSFHNSRIIM